MKRPRKYGPGEPFTSLDELLDFALRAWRDGTDAFVWQVFRNGKGRPEHAARTINGSALRLAAWTINGSALRLAQNLIPSGRIKRAVITDEYREWLKAEAGEVLS